MKKKQFLIVAIVASIFLTSGCAATIPESSLPEPVPTLVPEPEIPTNFATYTQEGLYNISYPSDWQPITSIMDEAWEGIKIEMEEDPLVYLEDTAMLFGAGKMTPETYYYTEGYYPTVNIITALRSTGYWTLEEIVKVESQYARENTPGYKEFSVYNVIVDGREAIIYDVEDNAPGYEKWRYIQLYTIKDDFVWCVTCGCESNDFNDYEHIFISIVRSLKILN